MIESKQIMAAVMSLILLTLGIFIVGTITTTTITGDTAVLDTRYDQTFPVTDPTIDQNFDTDEVALTGITVTAWNGVSWVAVPNANVSYALTIVTIQWGGLP